MTAADAARGPGGDAGLPATDLDGLLGLLSRAHLDYAWTNGPRHVDTEGRVWCQLRADRGGRVTDTAACKCPLTYAAMLRGRDGLQVDDWAEAARVLGIAHDAARAIATAADRLEYEDDEGEFEAHRLLRRRLLEATGLRDQHWRNGNDD